ncbi:MAG: hypothetical protein IT368_03185, partial [Candidatus Hydrogenedentes bacterium]|nr:hypothetical protein [Candidatus Hydrogenedentota bacterium]
MALPPEGNPLVSPRGRWILVRSTNGIDLCDTLAQTTVTLSAGVDYKSTAAAFSPDELRLAVLVPNTSGKSLSLDVFDLAGEHPALAGSEQLYFRAGSTSVSGALLFSASGELLVFLNGALLRCAPSNGRLLQAQAIAEGSAAPGAILAVANAAGDRIAIASDDNTVSIVTLDGTRQTILSGHQSPVSAMTFSRTGSRIITGTLDGSISIWDCQSGREVLPMESLHAPVRLLAFNGGSLVAASETETILLSPLIPDATDLPGAVDTPLPRRIARYQFGSARVAPEWGRCQHLLAEASLRAAAPGKADGVPDGCPAGGAYRVDPESLTYRCSLHGALLNANFVESLAEAVEAEATATGETGPYHDMLRRASTALPQEMPRLATDWVEQGRLLNAALFVAGSFSESGRAHFAPAEVRAALALGQVDRAVSVAARLKRPEQLGLSAYAHAWRGTPDDIRIAYENVLTALKDGQNNEDVQKACDELTRAGKGRDLEIAQQVEVLIHPQREAWRDLPWHKDKGTALERAAETTRPVLVFSSNPEAYYTEYMKKETFGLLDIQDELRSRFELLYIEGAEPGFDTPEGLPQGPGIAVLDPEGNVLFRRAGYVSTEDFREHILSAAGEPGIIRSLAVAGPFTPGDAGTLLPAEQAILDGAAMPPRDCANWAVCHADLRGRLRLDEYEEGLPEGDYLCWARIVCKAPTTATIRYALSHPAHIWVCGKKVETSEPSSGGRARLKVALPQGETALLVRLRGVSQSAQVRLALDPPSLASARLAPFDPSIPRRAALATTAPESPPADLPVVRIPVIKDDILKEWRHTWDTYAWDLVGQLQLEFVRSPTGGYRGIKC